MLFDLQRSSSIQMGEIKDGEESREVVYLPKAGENQSADRLRELLGLDPSLEIYEVEPGAGLRRGEGTDLIEINTRSLLGVLFFLSQGVKPPAVDVEAGRVTRTLQSDGTEFDWQGPLEGLFTVEHSKSAPENASTMVRYRGYWFYIKDDDLQSKATFMLLSQMFALRTGDTKGQTPILTIPVSN
jgi:hypothetical protein